MAKDFFQDITPPGGAQNPPRQLKPLPPEPGDHVEPAESELDAHPADGARDIPIRVSAPMSDATPPIDQASRGIRSISAPPRPRPLRAMGVPNRMDADIRESPPMMGGMPPRPPSRSRRLWIWAAASVFVLAVAGGLLFFFTSTTVTVTPKSRTAVLTSTPLTARQVTSLAEVPQGSLSYTVQSFDLEDSEVVAAEGTTHVESKASGSITVYNAYSASAVRLVKNTRFEASGGFIFRVLSDVMVPGKQGTTPGQVNVTVVADQAGETYNIAPEKFTLPGLKSTPLMYAGVYARSTAAMSGGFAGDQPGTAPGALEAAQALVRTRLETKAHEAAVGQAKEDTSVFPELMTIAYESLPNTSEAGSSVRIHQKAHVEIPVFPADAFAQAIAQAAFTDFDHAPVSMRPQGDFSVHALAPGDQDQVGVLNLVASGSTLIIWKVDTVALASALQGKDNSAFQGIVNGFSSVLEAHARISPFWKNTFPSKGSDIKIQVLEPAADK